MNLLRRKFIKTASFVGAAVTLGGGMLVPQRAIGAYMTAAFEAKDVSGALNGAMGSDQHSASDSIKLKAPDIAENGAVVPITVSADIANVDAISIVAESNATPLTSSYMLTSACEPFVSTRWALPTASLVSACLPTVSRLNWR